MQRRVYRHFVRHMRIKTCSILCVLEFKFEWRQTFEWRSRPGKNYPKFGRLIWKDDLQHYHPWSVIIGCHTARKIIFGLKNIYSIDVCCMLLRWSTWSIYCNYETKNRKIKSFWNKYQLLNIYQTTKIPDSFWTVGML